MPESKQAGHSIRVVAGLTSIPVETLRIWERRYGFPSPARKDGGNRRLYSDEEIERLRWVARALQAGYRPGDVIHKAPDEILALLKERAQPSTTSTLVREAGVLDEFLVLLEREEIPALQALLRSSTNMGAKRFVTEIVQPLLVEVGERWARGSVSVRQEHLLSECVTTELRILLSSFKEPASGPTVLLATLPNEPHGLGLDMVAVYLAASQIKARIIGVNTPPEQIVEGAHTLRADVVGLTVTEVSEPIATRTMLSRMLGDLPRRVSLWVGGSGAKYLSLKADGLVVVSSWEDLDRAIASLPR